MLWYNIFVNEIQREFLGR